MIHSLPDFAQANVLVVGDVMLDRYWHGGTSRISPEAPVPVVHIRDHEDRPGGAANVALNIQALGANASLIGVTGIDETGEALANKLTASGVTHYFHQIPDVPTVTKLRIISRNQQLIRLDFEEKKIHHALDAVLDIYRQQLNKADVVILSDYGKGVIHDPQIFIKLANEKNIPVLVDPKGNDFERYRGAFMLTPNRKEFEIVVGECETEEEIDTFGAQAIADNNLQALLVTRGEQGMTLLRPEHESLTLPARAREVYDVTGAGDTVIAVLASALAAKADLETATMLANVAASRAVAKLGTATVTLPELRRELQKVSGYNNGVMTEEQILTIIEDARAHGERVVMTNGCFDILHAGHVTYLEQAKALGDRLIIAVNDDDSVRGLKGPTRPINSLNRRMDVLAGLGAVDWVVPFSEETPERIIARLLPDVLVKGGDYNAEELAGYDAVTKNGGDVKILTFVDGCSTTSMVEKLMETTE